jgi:hypothetical protein
VTTAEGFDSAVAALREIGGVEHHARATVRLDIHVKAKLGGGPTLGLAGSDRLVIVVVLFQIVGEVMEIEIRKIRRARNRAGFEGRIIGGPLSRALAGELRRWGMVSRLGLGAALRARWYV